MRGTNATWALGILSAVLLATMPGCSGGEDARTAPVFTKTRHWTMDIYDLYRAGQPEKARDLAMRHVDQSLAAYDRQPRLELKIGTLGFAPFVAGIVLDCEKKYVKSETEPFDESSRKAATPFIEKMERAAKLAAGLTANVTLGEREQLRLTQLEEKRATMLKQWVLMHPRDQREGIYKKHAEFLDSQGIKFADLVDADKPRPPTEDDLLLENAKAESEAIRQAIDAYYRALFDEDVKALKTALSKKMSEERILCKLAKWQRERKEESITGVPAVDLDKAVLKPVRVVDKRVFVRVEKFTITLEKEGHSSVVVETEGFYVVKEDERWVLCLP